MQACAACVLKTLGAAVRFGNPWVLAVLGVDLVGVGRGIAGVRVARFLLFVSPFSPER
ncbi:MAG: hypothetical protein AAFR84_04235 [Pseudomonadota bacterium]